MILQLLQPATVNCELTLTLPEHTGMISLAVMFAVEDFGCFTSVVIPLISCFSTGTEDTTL